jgi:hypothetical protein
MITLLSMLAALVAIATGMAMLHDATPVPADRSAVGWLRHGIRLALLLAITICGATVLCLPSARAHSLSQAVFCLALAGFMALQSPCPWWAYVLKGRSSTAQPPPAAGPVA